MSMARLWGAINVSEWRLASFSLQYGWFTGSPGV
jgi:hypothetical protein